MFKIYKPIKYTFITQGYGLLNTHPDLIPWYQELGLNNGHNGFDFSSQNQPEVHYNASVKGIVYKTGVYSDGCKYISIIAEHEGKFYQLRYLHLKDFLVEPGQILEGGEAIAHADNTGKYTTGEHLHFDLSEMVKTGNSYSYASTENGGQTDPSPYYINDFILDVMAKQKEVISKLQQLIDLIKKILGL